MEFEEKKLQLEEGKTKLQLTLDQARLQSDDKERSRQLDLDRLRIEHNVPTSAPVVPATDGFKLSSSVKFVPRFDNSQFAFYLLAFDKAMSLHTFFS